MLAGKIGRRATLLPRLLEGHTRWAPPLWQLPAVRWSLKGPEPRWSQPMPRGQDLLERPDKLGARILIWGG